ncbi:MAG TPA: hypothetical protein VG477_16215 [Thermoanaerobaculia bacterium]|nr:hypothetical protein [Thermoanaerobaculia bacterium]
MSDHTIEIKIIAGDVVQADPNPFPSEGEPEIQPGDIVTWNLPPNRKMRGVFEKARDLPLKGDSLQDTDPEGPFESLRVEQGRIVGKVRADLPAESAGKRFFYTLLEDDKEIKWKEKPPGAPDTRLGGGVDIPTKPPRGGVDG